jgi:hypothetical protein
MTRGLTLGIWLLSPPTLASFDESRTSEIELMQARQAVGLGCRSLREQQQPSGCPFWPRDADSSFHTGASWSLRWCKSDPQMEALVRSNSSRPPLLRPTRLLFSSLQVTLATLASASACRSLTWVGVRSVALCSQSKRQTACHSFTSLSAQHSFPAQKSAGLCPSL